MRLKVPLTGTVVSENPPVGAEGDGIRPVSIDFGNVSWVMINLDLENETMEIEITPSDAFSPPELDADGKQVIDEEGVLKFKPRRKATEEEKAQFLQHARELVEGHTKEELYQMSGCPRLKRPLKG